MSKKKTKPGIVSILLVGAGLAGAVFAIVGLFVSWFAGSVTLFGHTETEFYGLFENFRPVSDDVFPIALVRAFGIAAAVLAVICAAVILLKAFNVKKVGGFIKLLIVAAAVICGILAVVFACSFTGSLGGVDAGDLGGTGFAPAFGAFFTGIGAIAGGAALLLK